MEPFICTYKNDSARLNSFLFFFFLFYLLCPRLKVISCKKESPENQGKSLSNACHQID